MSQASFHDRGGTWALSGASARFCRLASIRDFPVEGTVGPGLACERTAGPSIHICVAKRSDLSPWLHRTDDNQIPRMYSGVRYPRSIGLYGEARSFCRRPIGPLVPENSRFG